MKQSHFFTSSRPKRTYPFLVAFDLFCHFSICALGLALGGFAIRMAILTFAPNFWPAVVHYTLRLFQF